MFFKGIKYKWALFLINVFIFVKCVNTPEKETKFQQNKELINSGIGVLVIDNFEDKDTIKIYSDNNNIWYKFTFYDSESIVKFNYNNKKFLPFGFHPDYFILELVVKNEYKDKYEVIINEETKETKFIYKEKFMKFFSWSEYVLSLSSVGFDPNENPIRKKNSIQSEIIPFNHDFDYKPLMIEGEWLLLQWESDNKINNGWIKWKNKGKLIVYSYLPC